MRRCCRMGRLDELDLSLKLDQRQEALRLSAGGARLAQLRLALAGLLPFADGERKLGPALCVVFEGWDASGKGGAIKRLSWPLDPRHVRHASYGAPTEAELRHHYLWRFADPMPAWGGMTVYDRSWYGRVLVERVEGLATKQQWLRAYDEINGFERGLADGGTIFVKFWLHVSEHEQHKRFRERQQDPIKQYKLTAADWRNRELRKDYEHAVEEMLERTDTKHAPWTLVEGDSKKWARVKVMETTIAALEDGMTRHGFEPPAPLAAAGEGHG